MRKTIKIIGIYLFLIVVNQSCVSDHYYISGIEFYGATIIERGKKNEFNTLTQTDILKNDIVFIVKYNTEHYVAGLDLGLTEKCYAFSRNEVIDNYVLENTYSLKFNQPFTYKNITINANQNLLEIDGIKNEIEIYQSNNADKVFEFSQNFKKQSVFTSDDYEVTFSCSTSDNKNFEKKIIVKIEN